MYLPSVKEPRAYLRSAPLQDSKLVGPTVSPTQQLPSHPRPSPSCLPASCFQCLCYVLCESVLTPVHLPGPTARLFQNPVPVDRWCHCGVRHCQLRLNSWQGFNSYPNPYLQGCTLRSSGLSFSSTSPIYFSPTYLSHR